MEKMQVKIMGLAPMLMHSNRGVNPLDPLSLEIKKITKKRTKTEEDLLRLMDLEYEQSLYFDESVGVYMPAICVEAMIRDAAKKVRKGKDAQSAIFVEPDFIPLQYDGPKDLAGLLADNRFRDVRVARVNGKSSVLRCRPRFEKWAFECTINYEPTILDRQDIVSALDTGGKIIGLLDYRPRYGRFYAEVK